jgi:hypothetical protein
MPCLPFVPHLRVHHRSRYPQPILPVNYIFFLVVALPEDIAALTLIEQLNVAKTATARRWAYPFTGPFGQIVAFEFRRTPTISIYLNPEGDFAE